MLLQRPVNLQGGCRRSSEAADLVAVLVRQVEEQLKLKAKNSKSVTA